MWVDLSDGALWTYHTLNRHRQNWPYLEQKTDIPSANASNYKLQIKNYAINFPSLSKSNIKHTATTLNLLVVTSKFDSVTTALTSNV